MHVQGKGAKTNSKESAMPAHAMPMVLPRHNVLWEYAKVLQTPHGGEMSRLPVHPPPSSLSQGWINRREIGGMDMRRQRHGEAGMEGYARQHRGEAIWQGRAVGAQPCLRSC